MAHTSASAAAHFRSNRWTAWEPPHPVHLVVEVVVFLPGGRPGCLARWRLLRPRTGHRHR